MALPTRLAIHYQSPKNDPHKVPRPHFIDLATGTVTGGEVGDHLVFVCIHQRKDPMAGDGPYDVAQVVDYLESHPDDVFAGWRAAFQQGSDYDTTFSLLCLIERMELI